jgi:ribose transport system substrate-binding protein
MPLLERERMPVLFTVTTSVVSGLIVTGILAAVRTGLSGGVAFAWFGGTTAAVAALSVVAWLVYRIRRRVRRAFLVTSAIRQKYFIAAFVQSLHSAFDRSGIDVVLKLPEQDYEPSAQNRHLRHLEERRGEYRGGVVIATEAQRDRGGLGAFCRKVRVPVVFTDIEPFAEESAYPRNAVFVGYDTGALGELAGRWLVKRLRNTSGPRVLIIASREHGARQRRCAEALRLGLPDVSITVDESGKFVRSRASRVVRAYLRDLDPGQCLDAIFCTNDEMALGAVDAVAVDSPATRSTVVVGIDGVLEATALIDAADSPLRATVVQDDGALAERIVEVLEMMRCGEPVPVRNFLEAEVYEG